MQQELKTAKENLNKLNTKLQEEISKYQNLESNCYLTQEQLNLIKQTMPLPCFIWQKQGDGLFLVDYNQNAKNFSQFPIVPSLGQSAQIILSSTPEILDSIQNCLKTKTSVRQECEKFSYIAFCEFLATNSVILYLQPVPNTWVEQELRNRLCQQFAVASLGQKGIATNNVSLLMNEAVELVSKTLEINYSHILELSSNGSAFLQKAGFGWKQDLLGFPVVSASVSSLASYTLSTAKPVIIKDFYLETRFKLCPLLNNYKVVSGVSLVIPTQDHGSYILAVYSTRERKFTEDDINFLHAVSHIISASIESNRQKERLDLLERAIEASSNGIVITDAIMPNNPIIYTNSGFERITGYKSIEVIGLNCNFLQKNDTNQTNIVELRQAIQEGKECSAIIRNYRKDGKLFWNELYISPVHNSMGHLTHFIGVQTDITERKQAEDSLQLTQFSLDYALESVFWLTLEGTICYVNESACRALGYSREELLNLTIFDIDINFSCLVSQNKKLDYAFTFESIHIRKNGQQFPVEISCNYLEFNEQKYLCAFIRDITDRKKTENALWESQHRLNNILSSLEDVVWSVSRKNFQLLYVNPAIEKVYGRAGSEFLKKNTLWLEVVHPLDREEVRKAYWLLINQGISKDMEYRIVRPDGNIRWIRVRANLIGENDELSKLPDRIQGIITDITERKQAEEKLRQEHDLLNSITHTSVAAIIVVDTEGKINFANQRAQQLLGLAEGFEGENYQKADWTITDLKGNILPEESIPFVQVIQKKEAIFDLECMVKRANGTKRYLSINGSPLLEPSGAITGAVFSFADITDRKQMEEELFYRALHDSLTRLPNRLFFTEHLKQAIKKSKWAQNYMFAVLFIDLDRFKFINDSVGHIIGDKFLAEIANKLKACCNSQDIIARFGGDEFTILLENIHHEDDAIKVAQKIHQELKSPFYIDGYEVFSSASIGIALSSIGYERAEDILRDADITLYHAKASGRACYVIFDQVMRAQTFNRLQLENDLRRALKKGEFLVYYQPIISLKTRRIVGFEALIRWLHPAKGLISPVEFIPVAEDTGLIVPIGEWMLYQACQQLQSWQKQFALNTPLTVSVNLSGRQLKEPDLIKKIDVIIAETGTDSKQLKLEITESLLMENIEQVTEILLQLRDRHIQLSLDDFGTGYSSLSYLQRFPVNTLKIDRSFVNRLGQKAENLEIVQAIINLAHTLKMDVIAEGIETENQLQILKQLGCEQGQGYLISKPLPKNDIELLIMELSQQPIIN